MTNNPVSLADVVIIGAGTSGLAAAAALSQAGRRVLLVDKGRGVGGRVASRRIGDATFDHGAQFLSSTTPEFTSFLESLQPLGIARHWHEHGQETRWRVSPSMTGLPKHLAAGLDVRLETQISAIRRSGDQWGLDVQGQPEAGLTVPVLISTAPVPQALDLLHAGGTSLDPELLTRLRNITYDRCLTVMAVLDGPAPLPAPGLLQPADTSVALISDNHAKGISSRPCVTIQATPGFSLEHWDMDRTEAGQRLLDLASRWIPCGVTSFQVHGWKFSRPNRPDPGPCLVGCTTPLLVFAGDGFGSGTVESAYLSGQAAARAVVGNLDR